MKAIVDEDTCVGCGLCADNCPAVANPDQADADHDGIGVDVVLAAETLVANARTVGLGLDGDDLAAR